MGVFSTELGIRLSFVEIFKFQGGLNPPPSMPLALLRQHVHLPDMCVVKQSHSSIIFHCLIL
jgi:hypothetical protein